jgi:hypothetical protein
MAVVRRRGAESVGAVREREEMLGTLSLRKERKERKESAAGIPPGGGAGGKE